MIKKSGNKKDINRYVNRLKWTMFVGFLKSVVVG